MVHVQTGNGLDVVFDYDGDKMVVRGLHQHEWRGVNDARFIPLHDPHALLEVLTRILKQVEEHNEQKTTDRD